MKKGFTLIEILIAVSILIVISSIGYVSYSNSMSQSRDYRRKKDLKTIEVALQLYYQENKNYPQIPEALSVDSQPWISGLVPDFIPALPVDPKNNLNDGYIYGYASGDLAPYYDCSAARPWYLLAARLENENDAESLAANPDMVWCDGVTRVIDAWFGEDPTGANRVFVSVVRN